MKGSSEAEANPQIPPFHYSVAHFNKLVDLETEYATIGRNVSHGMEDWSKVNQEICRELQGALEVHDRGMLSKKMPATLVPLTPC